MILPAQFNAEKTLKTLKGRATVVDNNAVLIIEYQASEVASLLQRISEYDTLLVAERENARQYKLQHDSMHEAMSKMTDSVASQPAGALAKIREKISPNTSSLPPIPVTPTVAYDILSERGNCAAIALSSLSNAFTVDDVTQKPLSEQFRMVQARISSAILAQPKPIGGSRV